MGQVCCIPYTEQINGAKMSHLAKLKIKRTRKISVSNINIDKSSDNDENNHTIVGVSIKK